MGWINPDTGSDLLLSTPTYPHPPGRTRPQRAWAGSLLSRTAPPYQGSGRDVLAREATAQRLDLDAAPGFLIRPLGVRPRREPRLHHPHHDGAAPDQPAPIPSEEDPAEAALRPRRHPTNPQPMRSATRLEPRIKVRRGHATSIPSLLSGQHRGHGSKPGLTAGPPRSTQSPPSPMKTTIRLGGGCARALARRTGATVRRPAPCDPQTPHTTPHGDTDRA